VSTRITHTFERLAGSGRTAFIPYITAGDPDLATTLEVLDALASAGADLIELGVPFSDPMADGPVIELAMNRALAAGATLGGILEILAAFRGRHPDTPVVLFGYLNPLYRRGLEATCARIAEAGADGLLVVDLPPEEAPQLTRFSRAHGLDFIALFTPTSDDARVREIANHASGFAYYVSMAAVTGDRIGDLDVVARRVARVRALSGLPVGVGFGIRTPEDAARVAAFADGVVVGSALVETLARAPRGAEAAAARDFAAAFRAAIDAAPKRAE